MSLTDEKERLYKIASGGEHTESFGGIDQTKQSYWISYSESKHSKNILETYYSAELSDVRESLETIWEDDARMKAVIPVILAAYEKSRGNRKNYLREMEVFNYMM